MAFLGYLAFGLDAIDESQPRIANNLACRDFFFLSFSFVRILGNGKSSKFRDFAILILR